MTIGGATRVYALVGHPVAASRSPELHNGWFRRFGVDAVYVALDVPDATGQQIVRAIRTLGIAGANVTVPHKSSVLAHLDEVDAAAAEIGAVNTIVRRGERLVGLNTDAPGWLADLARRGIELDGRRAVLVGTGGAGRAIAGALLGAEIRELALINRTPSKAEAVADELRARSSGVRVQVRDLSADALAGADLVVVAVAGRPPALDELDPARLAPGAVWCDIDYRLPEPASSARARSAGCLVVDGRGMLWWQAALAFEAWTGLTPEPSPGSSTFWG